MSDALEVNDSSLQALASYLQKTLEPASRHEGKWHHTANKLSQEEHCPSLTNSPENVMRILRVFFFYSDFETI